MLQTRLFLAAALVVSASAFARAADPETPYRLTNAHVTGAAAINGSGAPAPYAPGVAYPVLNAPLYPSPVQYTPPWTGGTIITNQALAPHEMLYPHKYHAMYGPFYYKVRGSWFVTPFGVQQHEKWKLEGTQVKVKYHPHHKLFSGFHPPVSH